VSNEKPFSNSESYSFLKAAAMADALNPVKYPVIFHITAFCARPARSHLCEFSRAFCFTFMCFIPRTVLK
ncbi:MAG: hypothetical protein KKA05_02655, partial [Alphaproteobacteria bacterium]|nr:hypothetical protein [Alphaproteobacteria bacterium]